MALKKFLMVVFMAAVLVACGGSRNSEASSDRDSSNVTPQSSGSETSAPSSSLLFGRTSCDVNTDENCFKDERDGQTYKTVKIGTQTWMAENLNYAYTDVPYKYEKNDKEYTSDSVSWCYRNKPDNCVKYGRLYTWAAAMDSVGTWSTNGKGCGYGSTCSPTGTVRGICPEGWHLPDSTEWRTLFTAVGGKSGKMLKSTSGWFFGGENGNGSDSYSFSALPAGYRDYNGNYNQEGYLAYFWSSVEYSSSFAYAMSLIYYNVDAFVFVVNASIGASVRCVKDDGRSSVTLQSSSSETSVSSSSSSLSSSWSGAIGSSSSFLEGYVDPSTVIMGELTDERDGQTYKTVKIGTQIWMAENLNYAYIGVPYSYKEKDKDSVYTSDSTSWCYGYYSANCVKYGRLYTWAAAMDSVGTWSSNGKGCGYETECSPTYPVRGVCPEGWHLPTQEEWGALFAAVGGLSTAVKMLKSTSGWDDFFKINGNGMDAYAFSALPAGTRDYDGRFSKEGCATYFWSSTESHSYGAYNVVFWNNINDYVFKLKYDKFDGSSVRCVKD